ncbi:hypothetical protein MAPG_09046 [Magnaporthiopsis poae ATCC 64411]|uniref:Nucleolar protein 16 n=1 Tax=Magnaporthiopsis poae (strain ATCC 64411 / 73-15) TaxID=644358 RepID=A0A0C4E8X4_MAGP6|nr:hypothetical protein MAPG_09046 [Magnaporthiopsis poae ATCC 64411]
MGRTVRQKRKARSSRPKIQQSNKPKKQLNPLGNSIIARNWNKNETLTQNYRRLGLLNRLKAPSGGVDKTAEAATPLKKQPLAISSAIPGAVREVRVERDAAGKIVRIVRPGESENPLNDPLNDILSDDSDGGGGGGGHDGWDGLSGSEDEREASAATTKDRRRPYKVADDLERMARVPVAKTARHVSEREAEWLGRLAARHGDDFKAMARDHRLNPMQQTPAQIAKRMRRWKGE